MFWFGLTLLSVVVNMFWFGVALIWFALRSVLPRPGSGLGLCGSALVRAGSVLAWFGAVPVRVAFCSAPL